MRPRLPPPRIPDHEGHPAPGLAEALSEIDRRYGSHPMRRALRAAAAYNYGDALRWHVEMNAALGEFAFERGLTRCEVDRLVLPSRRWVERRLPGIVGAPPRRDPPGDPS